VDLLGILNENTRVSRLSASVVVISREGEVPGLN